MPKLARDFRSIPIALTWLTLLVPAAVGLAEEISGTEVVFPTDDGGEIHALLYGEGDHGVVLAHGRVFDKESWGPLPSRLAAAGFKVVAIDFRGYGESRGGTDGQKLFLDVIAAMHFLKATGVSQMSLVGASMGGGVVARTAVVVEAGQIDRLVLLAPAAIPQPEQMHAKRIVYIIAEGDPSIETTRKQYALAPEPKSLEILPGDAHAQHMFDTEQEEALIQAILEALSN